MSILPVMIFSGGDHFQRERAFREKKKEWIRQGWDCLESSVETMWNDLEVPLFFASPRILEIRSAAGLDAKKVISFLEKDPPDLAIAFVIDREIRKTEKIFQVKAHKKVGSINFPVPPFYQKDSKAILFVQDEVARHQKSIAPELAKALVFRVGTDLGMLSFEISKFVCVTEGDQIHPHTVRDLMVDLMEYSVDPLVKSLGSKNVKSFIQSAVRIKKTHRFDPTMKICALLGSACQQWLSVSYMIKRGWQEEQIVKSLGGHPYHIRKSVIPYASRWEVSGLVEVFSALDEAETAVVEGRLSPWNILISRISAIMIS